MNYEHYKIFITVCKHKNITSAAEELFSSQPAVTRIIQSMESELGCKLFLRSKNGVELTRNGRHLFEAIAEPCNLLMRAENDLIKTMGSYENTIYIGTTYTALQCFLFKFLDLFRETYSNLNYKIFTGSSSQLIDQMQRGEIDVVFNTTPFPSKYNLSVCKMQLLHDILVGGQSFKDLSERERSIKEIAHFPFILLSQGMQYRQFCDDYFINNNICITPSVEADSSGLIVPMAIHNWGLTIVPTKMAESALENGELFKINIREKIPNRYITLITEPNRPVSKAVQSMYDFASEYRL